MDSKDISMKTGDTQLDEDHETLLRLSRVLLDARRDEFIDLMEEIRTEASKHFATEDEDLRSLGGNNSICHLDEHALVLKSIDEICEILHDPATTEAASFQVVSGFALEMLRWLPEHVNQMDIGLVEMRTRKRFGGSAVMLKIGNKAV